MMKKTINIFVSTFVSLTLLFAFYSCSDDNNESENWLVEVATVYPLDNGNNYYLKLDDGTTLWPKIKGSYTPKADQRVYLLYTPLSDPIQDYDKMVQINYIRNILTKGIAEINSAAENDSIGNDPIDVRSIWIGDDYLNFSFEIMTQVQSHMITLAKNNLTSNPADGKIYLEFRHNANGDYPYESSWSLAAFSIRPYVENLTDDETIDFEISWTNYSGVQKKYNIQYKKNAQNTSVTNLDGEIPKSTLE